MQGTVNYTSACCSTYLKPLLRYKFLISDTYHPDALYLSMDARIRGYFSMPIGVREQKRLGINALYITSKCRKLKILVRIVRNVFCYLKKKPGHLKPWNEFYGTQGQSPLNPKIRDCPSRSGTNRIPLRCLQLFPFLVWLNVAGATASYRNSLANSVSVCTSRHQAYTVWPPSLIHRTVQLNFKFNNFLHNTFICQLMLRHASGFTVVHL